MIADRRPTHTPRSARRPERAARRRARGARRPAAVGLLGLQPAAALVLAACHPGPAPYRGPEPDLEAGARPIGQAEVALMAEPGSVVRFRVTAEGAVAASLDGTLYLGARNRARLEASGRFDDREGRLLLVSDGTWMQVHDMEGPAVVRRTPPYLNEALVVGLVRMGVLHNLARLFTAEAPDQAGPGPRGWLRLLDPQLEETPGGAAIVRYELEVGGTPAATVRLVLDPAPDPEGPVPVERAQTVRFPRGEMRVEELYTLVRTRVAPDASLFELTPVPY